FVCVTYAASTELYTLSLHDALPICARRERAAAREGAAGGGRCASRDSIAERGAAAHRAAVDRQGSRRASAAPHRELDRPAAPGRSEAHTSELQSRENLVCRLLLEKK